MRRRTRGPGERALGAVALALAIVAAIAARQHLGVEWGVDSLRALVDRMGWWAPAGFVLLVAFRTPLLLPSQLVLVGAGLCFGTARGTLVGALGILLSGSFSFLVTRWLGADLLRERVPLGLQRTLERAGSRGGAALLALATAYPIGPLLLYHSTAGLTSISFAAFLLALLASAPPRAFLYAYFASSVVEGSWNHVAVASLVFGLCMLPLLHPRLRLWIRNQFDVDRPVAGASPAAGD